MTVRPWCPTSSILDRHLRWKRASPTARTSSTNRISVSRCAATRERQPHVHAARIVLHRRIEEPLHLGEGDDFVELAVDLGAAHAEDRAIQEDVLASRQLGMEARPDFQQRADAAADLRLPPRRLDDARQHLEQRALARAVAADHADHFARLDVEGDTVQRPEAVLLAPGRARLAAQCAADPSERRLGAVGDRIAQSPVAVMLLGAEDLVLLGEVVDFDGGSGHGVLRLGDVGEAALDAAEEERAADKAGDRDRGRDGNDFPRSVAGAQQGPAEALDDPHHRIDGIEQLP